MNTRLTIDLGEPRLLTLLKITAAQTGKTLREVVVEALESHFSSRRENQAILKMAEKTFAEWDNPRDSEYDKLSAR
ncbi:MAG: hypothetical protein Q7T11_07365 [Deltaproteobacteria bacterium]|nr:hypothetical protein [Deltaproteobacteria bacterium]